MIETPTTERRTQRRFKPPKPSIRMFFLLIFDKTAKKLFTHKILLPSMVLLFLFASVSIVWSLYYRLPDINKSISLLNDQIAIENELEVLQTKISPEEISLIEQRISQAQSKVFASFPDFATWLKHKADFAQLLGLDMTYRLTQENSTDIHQILAITAELKLTVNKKSSDKSYVHLLAFMRSLIDENWHLEILGNEFNSNGKGITNMNLTISVWLKNSGSIATTSPVNEALNETFIQ